MNGRAPVRILSALGLGLALSAGTMESVPGQDVVVLKNGQRLVGQLDGITDKIANLTLAGAAGGSARRTLAAEAIDWIEFGFREGEEALHAHRAEGAAADLRPWWEFHFPHLHRPRSRAASYGLAYAEALLRENAPTGADKAFALFDRIAERAWSPEDRLAARRGRVRALLGKGELKAARAAAAELAGETGDPALLLEAEHRLALADFEELRRLLQENPRWEEDEEVRPRRNELYHRALDAFLRPHLFHATREEVAARGLHSAAELFLLAGEAEEAAARWEDLVKLYPETSFSAIAAARLTSAPSEGEAASPPPSLPPDPAKDPPRTEP